MRWFRRRPPEPLAPVIRPQPTDVPLLFPEPWRRHRQAGEIALIPTSVLLTIADPFEQARIRRREQYRLDEIGPDIRSNGIREPLELAVDEGGRVCLQNGNHRLIVAVDGGIERLPVVFKRSGGVRMHSAATRDLLGPLLSSPAPELVLRRAAQFALAAIEDAGERGWALGDAVCALRLALGYPVSDLERERMAGIDPSLGALRHP